MGIYTRSHSTRENIAGQIMKALLLLVFSRSSHGRPQIGNTEPEQQNIVSLQSGQQQFMNQLLQQIESNTTTNFVLSPHSIHSVFSQLLQGSGGRTKEELESLLGVRASDSLIEQYRILGQGLAGEGFKQIYADRPSQCRHLHTGLGPKTWRTRPCKYQNQWEVSKDLHFHPQVQVEVQDLPEAADGGAWREGPLRPVCQPDWHQRRGPLSLRGGAPGVHRGERGGDRGCSSHRSCCGLENCSAEEEGVLRRSALPLCRLRLRAWRHLVRRQGGQPQQRQRDPDESSSDPRAWNCASQSIHGGLCGLQQDVPGLPQFPGQLKHL